jgi:hypothetical protein
MMMALSVLFMLAFGLAAERFILRPIFAYTRKQILEAQDGK